jgi:hypothetical protein
MTQKVKRHRKVLGWNLIADKLILHGAFARRFTLMSTRYSVYKNYKVVLSKLKETVSRDFRPLVFFINQLPLGP